MHIFSKASAVNAGRFCHRDILCAWLGAAADFPGIVLHADGPRVEGYLFISSNLEAHWPMLDEFEDGYDRVEVMVTTAEGDQVKAWIYQLQPRSA
ncbi:AIG2 family protein [Enterobacter cloacae]|uniref:AIG2 family protein n=1 Tax=Enterobacter cloacae TaxID=550 RepID=A0A377LXR8_ENTCL|nr:AIG2 family protein [Enterobacter cloacae]